MAIPNICNGDCIYCDNIFTKEELDKELAFVLVQTKSTIFTNDDNSFVPKEEPTLTGINAILEKQKNKKK